MRTILSTWILGDQLLAGHSALAAARRATGRDNVRAVLKVRQHTINIAPEMIQYPYEQ